MASDGELLRGPLMEEFASFAVRQMETAPVSTVHMWEDFGWAMEALFRSNRAQPAPGEDFARAVAARVYLAQFEAKHGEFEAARVERAARRVSGQ